MPPRRLEVLVLSARGFGDVKDADAEQCRRKVELAVVSRPDSSGEKFGLKNSQWATLQSDGPFATRFGRSGLRAIFPLAGRFSPDYVNDPKFIVSAELRIRLHASGISTNNPSLLWAQSILPTSVARSAAKAIDNSTAWIEAEARISLEDMLASEPDSHFSGWRKLHRLQLTGSELDLEPLEVWMQAFILPDAEPQLMRLNQEYREVGSSMKDFRANGCNWTLKPPIQSSPPLEEASAKQHVQPNMVVVPPGIEPGMLFGVQGKPHVHRIQCPTGLQSGDAFKLASPTTGAPLNITIPPSVQPGVFFMVTEFMPMQMECPPGATPGSMVEYKPVPVAVTTGNIMTVQCPLDKGPGESMHVHLASMNAMVTVEVPQNVAPGQNFAIQVPSAAQTASNLELNVENGSTQVTPNVDLLDISQENGLGDCGVEVSLLNLESEQLHPSSCAPSPDKMLQERGVLESFDEHWNVPIVANAGTAERFI